MQGMSERQYAARVGLSRGAIQKAKVAGRLVLHADGSIDADASDARRAAMGIDAERRIWLDRIMRGNTTCRGRRRDVQGARPR